MRFFLTILLNVIAYCVFAQDTTIVPSPSKPDKIFNVSGDTAIADSLKRADLVSCIDSLAQHSKVIYGIASFYSRKFHGRRTANGEVFSLYKMTCACNKVPMGTWLRVTNLRNNKSVIVRVNDRLNKKMKRLVDLTLTAAIKLEFTTRGLTRVKVEVLGKKPRVIW